MRSAEQRFFKPIIETQNTAAVKKDYILNLLMTAVEEYDKQCQKSAPNKAAIKRKKEFLLKIDALNAADDLLAQNNAFTDICDFYLTYRNSGRLLNQVGDVLIYIFNLQNEMQLLDQAYKFKLKKMKNPHDPDYVTSSRMRNFEIALTMETWSTSKINLLNNALQNQKKYGHYIIATYENVRPNLGNALTDIVASYIPR